MKKEKYINTLGLVNKDMNKAVYALRRNVMDLIYEIKTLADLPRIEVRITTNNERILGCARMEKDIIWIPEIVATDKKYDLRTIVYHEVLHAVYGIKHDEKCPVMKAEYSKVSKEECQRIFLKYVNAVNNAERQKE